MRRLRPYFRIIRKLHKQGSGCKAILAWIEADINNAAITGFWDGMDIEIWRHDMRRDIRCYTRSLDRKKRKA